MYTQIVQCDSNYVAVRSLQINIIEDISCGERSHNRCWYLHLYSVNIKSKHRWYPNISFGLLHCSIILSHFHLAKISWPHRGLWMRKWPSGIFHENLFLVYEEKWVSPSLPSLLPTLEKDYPEYRNKSY